MQICVCVPPPHPSQVIELFELTAQLMAEQQSKEGPKATREDTKRVLGEVWDESDRRQLALLCCASLARLLADEGVLLNIGVVGKAKDGDKNFLTKVTARDHGTHSAARKEWMMATGSSAHSSMHAHATAPSSMGPNGPLASAS